MPSVLYDKFLADANGWLNPEFKTRIPLRAIVHVTGGGIKSKFAEDILFPRGLSAELDNLWVPPEIMKQCAKWREMKSAECYEVWNGGQGMLLVVDETDVESMINLARDHGIQAMVSGRITKETKPTVSIRSRFDGSLMEYSAG